MPTLRLAHNATAYLLALSLAACTTKPPVTPTPPPAPTAAPLAPTLPAGTPLPDDEATAVMFVLSGSKSASETAIEHILAANDIRFIPVFLELMRAEEIGLTTGANYFQHLTALQKLSGQNFGPDWPAWVEWYGATDIVPPPGFTTWKGQLLSQIDPGFGEFLRDEFPSRIRVEEIQWGGVRVDGIPALDNAKMIPADEARYLTPEEPVFGLALNGDARAYPLRILDWHEMANDVVGGVPVSLAYCTLCGAGIAFDGRASDGNIYTYGSSGFLVRSNKLMYDRQTRTLWNHLTGEPVLGPLADSDIKLNLLPIVLTTWADWHTQHPETVVLDVNTGYDRPYTPGSAYGDYYTSPETMFPVWQRDNLLPAKARVYALNLNGVPKAYPVEVLATEQVVNDAIGETAVVLIATRGEINVTGLSRRAGEVTYNAGGEVRAYERGAHIFMPSPEADTVLDSSSQPWRITEEALVGPTGELAPRMSGHLAYWFGWFAFFPNTLVYGLSIPGTPAP